MSELQTFAQIMRQKRIELNIQQQDLAEYIRVVPVYISRIEMGKLRPGIEKLEKICYRLDLNFDAMILLLTAEKENDSHAKGLHYHIYEKYIEGLVVK